MKLSKMAVLLLATVGALMGATQTFAATTITAASGGAAISATNTGGAWSTLTGPALSESAAGAIGGGSSGHTGTIILLAPTGFQFNTNAAVTVRVTGSSTAANNINDTPNNGTIPVSVTATSLTLTVTAISSSKNTLTWQNIQVRPTASTPLASGNLTEAGTCTFQGLTGSWGTLTEVAGPAVKLLVLMPGESLAPDAPTGRVGQPTAQTAGTVFSLTVNAVDAYGNPVTSSHSVALSSSDPNAVLPSTAALSGGTRTFSSTFRTAGNWTVTATDVSTGPLAPNTGSLTTATPAAFAGLQLLLPGETAAPGTSSGKTGSPTVQSIGSPFAVTVSAVDAYWNHISTNDLVRLLSTDTNGVLPADTSLANGTQILTVTLYTAGSRTLTVQDITHSAIPSTVSSSFTVTPGPFVALQLVMPGETALPGSLVGKTGTPSTQTAGTAFNLTVNAVDARWNIVSTNHSVGIACSDPNAALPTSAPLVGGTRTFSLTFKTAGNQAVTANDITDATKASAASPTMLVTAGAFAKLQLLVPGETAAPGTVRGKSGTPLSQFTSAPFTVTVNGVDADWNLINTNDTIQLTASDPQAVLPANAPLVAGSRTFSVALQTPGPATLMASNVTHTAIAGSVSSTLTNTPPATDFTTNTYDFTYADRQALLADGWNFLATLPDGSTRNTEITNAADGAMVSYDQAAHPGVLRLPTDAGDLWGTGNNTRNSLFHNLSSNWVSLRLDFSFSPTANYQQAQLALYQDDDNYVEVGHAFSGSLGGEAVTLLREDGGVQSSWSPLILGRVNLTASRLYLRLDRDVVTDKITGFYSFDSTNWVSLGQAYQSLTNPRVCVWTGGSSGGFPNCDVRRVQVINSTAPLNPILIAQPQHLVFNAVAGQSCTNLQQLRVIARRSLGTQGYTVTSSAPWLLASPQVTNTPGFCNAGVNSAGLAAGVYEGTLTCSAPGAASAVTRVSLIVNPAVRARASTWRGARAGAMTVWVDDAQPTAFDELTANGFAGTYLLWGNEPGSALYSIPSFSTNYYQAGMELGGHTVDHVCLTLDEPAIRYELEANIASILANTPEPSNNLVSFAFPCGNGPIPAQVDAADYYLAVHSYNVNQLEDPSPYNFMFLKTYNSHEHTPYPPADFKVLVQAAVAQGKWYNMVLHTTNNSDGAITYAAGQDIWVAPGGSVTKYILQRDRTIITNYQETAGQISFNFYRLPLDSSAVRNFESAIGAQDRLTFQVDTTGTNAVYSVTVNGSAVSSSVKIVGGRTLMLFDAPVTATPQSAVLRPVPNRPPVLPVIASQAISQFATLRVTNTATDPDLPAQRLTYALVSPPAGAQVDANGVIQWTPGASEEPGTYTLTTVVTDNGQPPLNATNSLSVTVQPQVWLALPSLGNATVNAGVALVVTNTATYTRPLNPWATNTLAFTYTNRNALLADGWSFIASTPGVGLRNTEITNPAVGAVLSYDQAAHPGTLRIPCDLGDLWASENDSRNALFRSLPTNWASLQLALAFAPAQDYQQVHLAVSQDDDNYIQAGFAFNTGLGGQVATLILETNAIPNHFFSALYNVTNLYLQLAQAGTSGHVTALYSLDHTNWQTIGAYDQALVNPRLSIWVGGSPVPWSSGLPNVDLRRLDVVTSNSAAAVLNYTLLNGPAGASIDTNGVIRWTPTLDQAPSTNLITTVVTDNQTPPVSVTNTLVVVVNNILTVAADNQSRLYGTTNPILTGTLSGVRPGDNITATYATTATPASPVGTYAIVPVLIDPEGKLTNYTVLSTNALLTVTPAPLTIAAENKTRFYGQANPAFTAAYTGFVNGDTTDALGGALAFDTPAGTNSPVGTYPITPAGLSASNYTLFYAPGALSVLPAPLLVTAADATRAYGQTNPLFRARFSGLVNNEDASVLGGQLTLSSPAQTNSPVGTYPIEPNGLSATNYTLSYSNGTLTVTAFALLVKADDQTRSYGAPNPVLTGTLMGLQNEDNITASYATAADTNSPVGDYEIMPALNDPDHKLTNYSLTLSNGTLLITPAPLQVAARDTTRAYGQPNPLFSAEFSGFVNGEDTNALQGLLVLSTAAQVDSPVGSYPIVPAGLSATNYALSYVSGTLAIATSPLFVSAQSRSRFYGATNPVLTGTLSGVLNGDNLTASCSTAAQTNSPVGAYAITPSVNDPDARLSNYTLTTSNGILSVVPAPLLVTAADATRAYGQTNPPLSARFTGLVNNEDASVLGGQLFFSTAAQTNSPVGTYPIEVSGLSATNYTLSYSNGTLTVTAFALLVRADDQTRSYGAPNRVLTGSLTGLQNEDNITASYTTAADTNSPVGGYEIIPALNDPDHKLTNYSLTLSNGTLTITPTLLAVSADNQFRTYGQTNPALTGSLSGLRNADNISAEFATTATVPSGVGSYPITVSLADPANRLSNYSVTTNNGTLTIGPALLTVSADNQSRLYGTTNPMLSATITGYVNGETAAVLSGAPELRTSATPGSSVGSYPITASAGSLQASNYAFDFIDGALTVTPATLIAAADNQSRLYGQTNPALTVTYTGFVNGEDASILAAAPALATLAQTNSPVGAYAITISGPTPPNYNVQYQAGTLTVLPAPLLVLAQNASRPYGETNPPFTASLSGFLNGEDTNVLGGTLAFSTPASTNSPVGVYPIQPAGLSATNYTFIYSNGTLTVTAFALLVQADNQSRLYGTTNPVLTGALSGLQAGDTITASYLTLADTNSPVGTYAIVPTLQDPNHRLDNYTVSTNPGTLTVTPAPLTVTADNQYRNYGETNGPLTGTLSGLQNADNISASYTTPADSAAAVGVYPITIALSDPNQRLTNYTISVKEAQLFVYPAELTVKADDQSRPYGAPNPPLSGSLIGLKNNDNITAYYWTTAEVTNAPGDYLISAFLYDPDNRAGNYHLNYQEGTLRITPATSVLTLASSANPSLPGSNVTFTATVTAIPPTVGLPTGQVQFFVDGASLGPLASLSNGVITCSTASLAHGQRLVAAQYFGDGNFFGSTNSLSAPQLVNTPPRAGLVRAEAPPNRPTYLSVTNFLAQCVDADLDPLQVTGVSAQSLYGGTVSLSGGRITYSPPAGYTGPDTFNYTVSDPFGGTVAGLTFITVSTSAATLATLSGVQPQSGGGMWLSGFGAAGQTYLLQASTTLTNWMPVATNTAAADGTLSFFDSSAGNYPSRFYRLAKP